MKLVTMTKRKDTRTRPNGMKMKLKHSNRARDNMTKQLKAQLKFYQECVLEHEKTLKKVKAFAKWKLPGYQFELKRAQDGLTVVKKKLVGCKKRIKILQSTGKINKIL